MQENFLVLLFTPMTLLFLINAFFLVYLSSYIWNIFLNINYTNSLLHQNKVKDFSVLWKLVFFFPILIFALLAEYRWSLLTQVNFFPLVSSPFVRFNGLATIAALIAIFFIKYFDKEEEGKKFQLPIFVITYIIVVYLFYIILFIATITIRLNAFPDDFLSNYSYLTAERINLAVLYGLFLLHEIFIFFAVSFNAMQRLLLLLAYTITQAFVYFMIFFK